MVAWGKGKSYAILPPIITGLLFIGLKRTKAKAPNQRLEPTPAS
jgi:hypothetical protein